MSALTLDAEALYGELLRSVRPMVEPATRIVGIASGGVWLAERLATDLGAKAPGIITSSMHRDDVARRGVMSRQMATRLDFDVAGADILLVDDVLYTGRTIRAVLNELFDFGRPTRVRLAVLVDRGGRELPIAADVQAARVVLPRERSLALARDASGRLSFAEKAVSP